MTHPDDLRVFLNVGDVGVEEVIPEVFLTPSDCGQEPVFTLFN